ncbi:MAG: helix-turn-helix transcriptional regulator [Liquorilactobacillus ghanensis]|uniref:helix-turn-helix transcriptional regulator n=1 Tax=Liquorilactobacillus ghanensis TaxID=399370 RepID=UPI0039EA1A94
MDYRNWEVETVLKNIILKNRLKIARAEKNLNQSQLAKLVEVSRQTISNIETGEFVPSAKLALLLCMALDKPFESLFYFKEK